jgi:TonB-dependent receptor
VRQDARDYSNGALTATDYDLDYDYWLPSVNLLLRTVEGLQFRASYFQGVAPPDFGLTRAYFPINLQTNAEDIEAGGGRPIGRFNAGNPDLVPAESHNYDFTVEWYFADVGQLTFAPHELDNVRTNDQRRTFTNNGATFEAIVTTAVNSPETGKIKGFEVAYQQQYQFGEGWLSGFGLNANYTYVDSSGVPQSTLSETDRMSAGNPPWTPACCRWKACPRTPSTSNRSTSTASGRRA